MCMHNCLLCVLSRSKVLQSLLQQRDSGDLPGVCGRLGDLGTIDQRYDVAISTACGALDHIVVDTMETAVKCVSYLKHNGLGSATFIGLDKVDHLRGVAGKGVQVYVYTLKGIFHLAQLLI